MSQNTDLWFVFWIVMQYVDIFMDVKFLNSWILLSFKLKQTKDYVSAVYVYNLKLAVMNSWKRNH